MYELELFAGAGGGILGGLLRGHTCIGAVEIEEYPRKVLLQRQRDGILPNFPIWDDVRTFRIDNPETRGWIEVIRSVREELTISGGFPCQDISSAGTGSGITKDSRSGLWFEFARIIREIRPARVFVENSPVLTSRGLGIVLGDLAEMGYDAKWGVLGAVDLGAYHERERIWISATNTKEIRCNTRGLPEREKKKVTKPGICCDQYEIPGPKNIANSISKRAQVSSKRGFSSQQLPGSNGKNRPANNADTRNNRIVERIGELREDKQTSQRRRFDRGREKVYEGWEWWEVEPELARVVHGMANRVDRIKAIGNGQVPEVERTARELLE